MAQPKITIYSTKTCPFCKLEKEYLDEKKISYTNFFVDDDPTKADEMIRKSGQMGVPVTVIEKDGKEEIVIGFDKSKLNSLLGIS